MRKVVSKHPNDLDERLPVFLLAYRAWIQETKGTTPANMVFGRELLCPAARYSGLSLISSSPRPTTWRTSWIAAWYPSLCTPTSKGDHWQHEGPLRPPG
jgi:hypothetical protein